MDVRSDVLWACLVCERDSLWLPSHLPAVLASNPRPGQVLVIDNDASSVIRSQVQQHDTSCVRYLDSSTTHYFGYNTSFNLAVSNALGDDAIQWLAIMTPRAKPMCDWLGNALAAASDQDGMVATLHLTADKRVHCLGHFLSRSAACLDLGFKIGSLGLSTAPVGDVWSACAGGALYRTSFLRKALTSTNPICHPYGFFSNNCQGLGFLAREHGYETAVAPRAICHRDIEGSSSANPQSSGALMTLEINRITELLTYWPSDLQESALSKYLSEPRKASVDQIEKRAAVTFGRALRRQWAGFPKTRDALSAHLLAFDEIKAWMREWSA